MEFDQNALLYRNPNLIINRIDENFYAITNPFIDNGIKVINNFQFAILDIINGSETIDSIVFKTKQSRDEIKKLISILLEKQFISFDDHFPEPIWKRTNRSLNLWIQTTNECNLRCSYCYIHTLGMNDHLKDTDISYLIDKIVETVKRNKLRLVQLRLAGGEPLLRASQWKTKIPELREKLNLLGCELKIAFLSNIVALNNQLLEFMKKNSIGIGVSIDGIGVYQNATRHFKNGNGTFEIVNKNLQKLLDYGFKPSLMTVVSNSNLDGLEGFTKYVIEKKLHNRYSFVSGENISINKLINKMQLCYRIFESAIENGYEFTKLHQLCDLKFDKLFFQTCSDGYNGGALYVNGNVYFCQRHFGVEQPLGSIFEEDDILTIIQRKTYYKEIHNDCKSCIYRCFCTSGCPIERINGKDPHCEVYKSLIPIILRLRGKERLFKIKQLEINKF